MGLLSAPLGRFLPRLPRRASRTAGFLLTCEPPGRLIFALLSADHEVSLFEQEGGAGAKERRGGASRCL